MSIIVRQDSNGVKPLLQVGELGYDNFPAGGDAGRVYVGTGTENIAQAKKSEVIAVESKIVRITEELEDVNLNRADKWLASQNIAQMIYDVNGDLVKLQFIEATDVNYEIFSYTNGDLSGIAHYVDGELKGNSVLSYTDGNLTSVIFTEV